MDETQKRLQKERREYLLRLMTSASGGTINLDTYKFNRVYIFFGFTGCGKDAVIDGFLSKNKRYTFSKFVRTLTRPKRPAEKELIGGYFIEKELFDHLKERGRFFYSYEKYDGDEFGYDTTHLIFLLSHGNVIMVGGGEQNLGGLTGGIKSVFDNIPITTVFINRNKEDIIKSMTKRGGEADQIKKRTEFIEKNWSPKPQAHFDYIIWNDDLEGAIKEFGGIVTATAGHQE